MLVARVALEIPRVGLVMETARLVRWLKGVGDTVRQGEPLLEIETEKSVVEIESSQSGRIVELLLLPDQEARVGDRIAWLENDAADAAPRPAPATAAAAAAAARTAAAPASAAAGPAPAPARSGTVRIKSSPVALRLAAEQGLDLRRIAGTGPGGRVQLHDVQQAIAARSAAAAVCPAPAALQPLSSMRRALARSTSLSNATVPQFFVERSLDWSAVQRWRAQMRAQLPPPSPLPSITDFLLQAIARTLLAFPALNATFFGDAFAADAGIVAASGTHIGLVVALEQGLLIPVLHGVEQLGLLELARRRADTVERALTARLKREELEGATFSVSNLGARGPDRFNAILQPPQSAILAVGRRRDGVVSREGALQTRSISELTLTVDHRVADGRLASDFLAALVEFTEGDAWRLN